MKSLFAAWTGFWFRSVPPHLFALLRIAWGLLGLVALFGVSDMEAYWQLDGLVSPANSRIKGFVVQAVGADAAPLVAISAVIVVYLCMVAGVASPVVVPLAFLVAYAEVSWNRLPLSAAYQTHLNLLFCLALADCGRVWSVDAWWKRRRGVSPASGAAIWPLRLFRFQVCVIYFMSGWWKFQDVHWRDGSALHYVMSNVQFRRFPIDPPAWTAELLTMGTYVTLFWELSFPLLVLWRPTRVFALCLGLLLHSGMWLTVELGPFSWVMMASYLAFLDPDKVPALAARLKARVWRRADVAPTAAWP